MRQDLKICSLGLKHGIFIFPKTLHDPIVPAKTLFHELPQVSGASVMAIASVQFLTT